MRVRSADELAMIDGWEVGGERESQQISRHGLDERECVCGEMAGVGD